MGYCEKCLKECAGRSIHPVKKFSDKVVEFKKKIYKKKKNKKKNIKRG
jgi:hypothetical protein